MLTMIVLAINAWTFAIFAQDKRAAERGDRRVPESTLLGLCLIGGTPGAFAARALYRHKTRKQPFTTWLWMIAGAQFAAALFLIAFGPVLEF